MTLLAFISHLPVIEQFVEFALHQGGSCEAKIEAVLQGRIVRDRTTV